MTPIEPTYNSIALARKWRPQTFESLIGQEHVTRAMVHSLTHQRLHHAYLFTGTRGVGKTSIARLLAKALNCEQGITALPCLKCDTCVGIEQGRYIDLIEIDAASKTRVEDTRELLDNVPYAPTMGHFKIYIIDEVHMLSQHSFNALLKTLEEPPAHVKFLLATTDPQKLPATVLSRCLQFHLKPLKSELIDQHLKFILDKESISYDESACTLLAKFADGSMRDALTLLDQTIATGHGYVSLEAVQDSLGLTQEDYARQIIQALAKRDIITLINITKNIGATGGSYSKVLQDLMNELHQISIIQAVGSQHALLHYDVDLIERSQDFSPEDTQLMYQIALKGSQDILIAPTVMIGFEMTLLRIHTFMPVKPIKIPHEVYAPLTQTAPIEPTEEPTKQSIQPPEVFQETLQAEEISADTEAQMTLENIPLFDDFLPDKTVMVKPSYDVRKETKHESLLSWTETIVQLNLSGLALAAVENATWIAYDHGNITLSVSKSHQSLFTPSIIKKIELALQNIYQEKIKLNIQTDDDIQDTPAQNKLLQIKKNREQADEILASDPLFQSLQQAFSAEIIKDSVELIKDDI